VRLQCGVGPVWAYYALGWRQGWFRFCLFVRRRELPVTRNLLADLPQFLLVVNRILQQSIETILGLKTGSNLRKPGAQLQQFTQRLDLVGYGLRRKVRHLLKAKRDLQPCVIVSEPVLNIESQPGTAALQHIVEIRQVYMDEPSTPQVGQWLLRHTAEIPEDTDQEW
jgi:hypothetical protein